MIALKLEVPELSGVHKVVCCCPHLVSICALTPEELLTPMKPVERIDGIVVGREVEPVEAWDTGARAVTMVFVMVREGGNRCEVRRGSICGLSR